MIKTRRRIKTSLIKISVETGKRGKRVKIKRTCVQYSHKNFTEKSGGKTVKKRKVAGKCI